MEQSTRPFGINEWTSFLKNKQLPVLVKTVQRLEHLFANQDLSLQELVPVIEQDPIFTLHLVRLANSLNKNTETQVNTVELAVSTLGLDHIQNLCRQLPVIKINHASVPHRKYFHAVANSAHASVQAQFLCRSTNRSVVNDSRIAALFYGIGHWALWRYAPQEMSEINIHIYEKNNDVVMAENDVLGCTIQQISESLVESWNLSRLGTLALKHSTSPDAEMLERLHCYAQGDDSIEEAEHREIKQLLNATFYPVKLANWLALTVPYGWNKTKALRLIEIISDFMKNSENEALALLHQRCALSSRTFRVEGILSPAALMLLLPSDQVLSYRMDGKQPKLSDNGQAKAKKHHTATAKISSDTSPDKLAPKKKIPETTQETASQSATVQHSTDTTFKDKFANKAGFQKLANKMLKDTRLFKDDLDVYSDLLRGLKSGLGIKRVSLFKVDQQGQLSSLLHAGYSENDPMRRFSVNLEIPSLFKKLSHNPKAIWMTDENRKQIRAELPERFKACSNQRSFVLIPLYRGKTLIAFVYGDHDTEQAEISEFYFKYFKYLCAAANRCLNRISAPK